MKTIVHVETAIRVILGELDANGNVTKKTPLDFNVEKLTPEILADLCRQVNEAKEKMKCP